MDDAAFVHHREGREDVAADPDHLRDREGARDGAGLEGGALEEGHRVVREPVTLAGVIYGDHVRVAEARQELGLPAEPFDPLGGGQLGPEHLHGNDPAEGDLLGAEHHPHAAGCEFGLDQVVGGEGRTHAIEEAQVGPGKWGTATLRPTGRRVNGRGWGRPDDPLH